MFGKNDPEGKNFLRNFLEKRGLIVYESPYFYCRWDLMAVKDNINYYFELKTRPILSTEYGDSIIQMDKLNALRELENNNTKCFIVNFFIDCFYIVPINDEYNIQECYAQKQNSQKNNKVFKQLVSYPHKNKNKREYGK